jgi:hypothetical protein
LIPPTDAVKRGVPLDDPQYTPAELKFEPGSGDAASPELESIRPREQAPSPPQQPATFAQPGEGQ